MCGKACSVGVECQEPEKKDLGPTVVMMHVCIDDNVCSLMLNARRVRKKRPGTHCSVVMMRVCIEFRNRKKRHRPVLTVCFECV
jgi:hypothetical protein